MSIERSKARVSKIDKGTLGGDTFYVKLPGNKDPKALCFRKMHNEPSLRCTHEAGYRTSHLGTGACRFHGGAEKRPTITNGMTAVKTRLRLSDSINGYLQKDRGELLDLTQHLAATRAIFDEFIEHYPSPLMDEYGSWFGRFNTLIATLGTLVDKISRIDSRNTLTAAQVLYLRATMVDILMKYLPDPSLRERVVKEIATRMGGDMEISMMPSEISMSHNNTVDAEFVE
jgi:hypothetical protein